MKDTLEVGDKIRITNAFIKAVVTVNRVTKTKAIAGAYDFKRKIGGFGVMPFSPQRWDTTNYDLIEPETKL